MHYHCHKCKWELQGYSTIIHEILTHEKTHKVETKLVEKVEIKECINCNGTGKIEEKYMVEQDELPKTD